MGTLLLLLSTFVAAAEPPAVFSIPRDQQAAPIANSLSLAFGSTFFAEVKVSTHGAVGDLTRLSREGFYKRELIELLLISARSGKPLAEAAAKRRKGGTLRSIAVAFGLDYDALYDAASAVEEQVDRLYVPLYPVRPPPRGRDE